MASTTGKYSGLHPAMTAMVAIFSTVAVRFMGRKCDRITLLPGVAHLDRPVTDVVVFMEDDQFIRLVAGALEHLGHPFLGGYADRQAVGIDARSGVSASVGMISVCS